MKIPAYTKDPNVQDPQAEINRRVMSKSEWQKARMLMENKYVSVRTYINWGKKYYPNQFVLGRFLAKLLKKLKAGNILSLGCGDGYIEYAISQKLPMVKITASDFDNILISKLKRLNLPIRKFEVINIKANDFDKYYKKLDVVLMVAVFYLLSDDEAVMLLRKFSRIKVKNIIIVAVAFWWVDDVLKYLISKYFGGALIGRLKQIILGKTMINRPRGRFHGWTRTKGEFAKILRKEGSFKIKSITRWKEKKRDSAIIHIIPKK